MSPLKKGTKLTKNPKDIMLRTRIDQETADKLEAICPETDWPFPTYGKLLYSVN